MVLSYAAARVCKARPAHVGLVEAGAPHESKSQTTCVKDNYLSCQRTVAAKGGAIGGTCELQASAVGRAYRDVKEGVAQKRKSASAPVRVASYAGVGLQLAAVRCTAHAKLIGDQCVRALTRVELYT